MPGVATFIGGLQPSSHTLAYVTVQWLFGGARLACDRHCCGFRFSFPFSCALCKRVSGLTVGTACHRAGTSARCVRSLRRCNRASARPQTAPAPSVGTFSPSQAAVSTHSAAHPTVRDCRRLVVLTVRLLAAVGSLYHVYSTSTCFRRTCSRLTHYHAVSVNPNRDSRQPWCGNWQHR